MLKGFAVLFVLQPQSYQTQIDHFLGHLTIANRKNKSLISRLECSTHKKVLKTFRFIFGCHIDGGE